MVKVKCVENRELELKLLEYNGRRIVIKHLENSRMSGIKGNITNEVEVNRNYIIRELFRNDPF